MANQLRELGEVVVFENPAINNLHETGLTVMAHTDPVSIFQEAALMVVHDSRAPEPKNAIAQAGLMICFYVEPVEKTLIQGSESILLPNLQSHQIKVKRFSR